MRTKKRILPVLMAAIIAITGFSIAGTNQAAAATKNFTDLPSNHWAYSSIQKMREKGIIKGYPDGRFKPSATVTYGEFIKMAVVALNGKDDIVNASDATHWASGYYKAAMDKNLFNSKQISERQLSRDIPRADMALISANAIKAGTVDGYAELIESLPDVDKTTVNEYQIVQAYGSGLITGYEDGTFRPDGVLTRAEASTVIYRIIDKSARKIPEGVNVGKTTEEPKEEETTSSTSEWLEDEFGQYKLVNLSDYVDEDLTKKVALVSAADGTNFYFTDYYYVPTKVKLYKEPIKVLDELKTAPDGDKTFDLSEYAKDIVGIKNKKTITQADGLKKLGPMNNHVANMYYNPSDMDATTFDYFMAMGAPNPSDKDKDEATPRIYVNPFKK